MTRLILPGWHGSGDGHWQRYWLDEDPDARLVEQVDWDEPDLETWLAQLHREIARETAPVTLVAHSLGTTLVAHYAGRHPYALIAAALLVAPGDADLHAADSPDIASFAPVPRNKLPFPSLLVVSRNDALMAYDRALELGRDWGARIVDQGNAGHINRDSGYGRWPEALALTDELEVEAYGSPASATT
jgi:predicted alpha/beta hydrolase family esterase